MIRTAFIVASFLASLTACAPAQSPRKPDAAVEAMAKDWSGHIDFAPSFAALDPAGEQGSGKEAALFNANDEFSGLARTNGYVEVAGQCGACHSLQLVMQQRKDHAGWDGLVTKMVSMHGMVEPSKEDRTLIVDYLATNFSSEAP